MSGPGAWYRLIPLLLGTILVPGPVIAAPSLAEAIRKADAKYLERRRAMRPGSRPVAAMRRPRPPTWRSQKATSRRR